MMGGGIVMRWAIILGRNPISQVLTPSFCSTHISYWFQFLLFSFPFVLAVANSILSIRELTNYSWTQQMPIGSLL